MVSKLQSLLLCIAACVASSYGYSLDCNSFADSDYGTPVGQRYGGYCSINFGDGDQVNLVGINGDHTGHQLSDVQYLYVSGYGPTGSESVERLPSNLATLLPNLASLTWSSKLKHVQASDLAAWPNLIQLNLYNNMLRQLPGDLLSHNTKLQWIDFSMNSIQVIGSGFFNGLNQLTQINAYSNPCVNMYMQSTDINQVKADLSFYCEPLPAPVSNVCPAACSSRIDALNAKATASEAQVNAITSFIAALPAH